VLLTTGVFTYMIKHQNKAKGKEHGA
jgi:hypothetical protein